MSAAGVLVQLSDLHLRANDADEGPARRLQHVAGRVAALQPPADAVLLSGDLADAPSSAVYEQVHELLQPLGVPLYAIPGNHDDRDMLRNRFAPGTGYPGAAVNVAFDCGALRVVGLDSTASGLEGGVLGAEQLDWLDRTLVAQPERPTLLALHHPPVLTGIRSMDRIALAVEDRVALEALLERHPQVQATNCGHVHTAMTTSFAGRALLIAPSTNSAVRLDLRPDDQLPFSVAQHLLGFTVHTLIDGRLVSHVQPLEP